MIIYHIFNNNNNNNNTFVIDSIPANSECCYVVHVTIATTKNDKCLYLQEIFYVYLIINSLSVSFIAYNNGKL